MGLVNIDSIKPGMVLESDLLTPEGRFLLPKGAVLQENSIKTCKAWGVRQADIAGQDQKQLNESKLSQISPEFIEKSRQILKPLLRSANPDHPAMREIIRIAEEEIAKHLASGGSFPDSKDSVLAPEEIAWPKVSADKGARVSLQLVQAQSGLISLPETYHKIVEVLESPFSSAFHIADVVSKDSSLTARLLKLVNSAFYGFPANIDSINRAVALLGTKELTSLALGISVIGVFEGIPSSMLNMESFWKHSISCGVFASLISTSSQGGGDERFFVAGLLHDLGRLLMIRNMPERCLEIMSISRQTGIPLYQVEQKLLGFDHAEVGGLLCREWSMPATLEEMVRYHHEPSGSKNVKDAGTIHLANVLAMAAGSGSSGEAVLPALKDAAWDNLALDTSDFVPLVQQAQRQIEEIVNIFLNKGEGSA